MIDKSWPVSFKFRENCLGSICRRTVLMWYARDDHNIIPCKVKLPDKGFIFSTGEESGKKPGHDL